MKGISRNLIIILTGTICFLGLYYVNAQDINTAVKLTESEQFEAAENMYNALIAKEPNNGDYYFYFGDNYLRTYFSDTANTDLNEVAGKAYAKYLKGTEMEPLNPLNYVGIGKVDLYKDNFSAAKENFDKAQSLLPSRTNKTSTVTPEKQILVFMKIAEAYIKSDQKDTAIVFPLLRKAEKINKKNSDLYLLMGDAYLFILNDGTNAISNYKKAQELDPASPKAKLRLGQLWVRAQKYKEATGYYKEALDIDPSFAPAYRELGELNGMLGQYDDAMNNLKKYLELSNNNLYAKMRYASALFMVKKYDDAINQINEIFSIDKDSYNSLNRLLAYSYFETGQYDKGISYIEKFLNSTTKEKLIPSDYIYYSKLLSKKGNDSLAIEKYKLALKLDSSNCDLYTELITLCNKLKNYSSTAALYEQKIAMGKASTTEYFKLGQTYYNMKEWLKADSAFGYVNTKSPDYVPAYRWRALANANIDTTSKEGRAKPYYEMFIGKAKADSAKYSKDLPEAFGYLAYYYFVTKDYCSSRYFYEKVLAIDPKNPNATIVLNDKTINIKAKCPTTPADVPLKTDYNFAPINSLNLKVIPVNQLLMKLGYKNIILVPTDFSEICDSAISHAVKMAETFDYKVVILHVITKDETDKAGIAKKLASVAAGFKSKSNIEIETILTEGTIFDKIPEVAKNINASLIILGTSGKAGLQNITGSFALKVITASAVPTIVVQKRPFPGGYKNIVLPITTGGSPQVKTQWALSIAKQYGSKIDIIQLNNSDELNASVEVITDSFDKNKISYTKKIADGSNFTEQVINYAVTNNADLIVIMTNPDSQLKKFILGSYDEQIIFNTSQIPVMCINPQ